MKLENPDGRELHVGIRGAGGAPQTFAATGTAREVGFTGLEPQTHHGVAADFTAALDSPAAKVRWIRTLPAGHEDELLHKDITVEADTATVYLLMGETKSYGLRLLPCHESGGNPTGRRRIDVEAQSYGLGQQLDAEPLSPRPGQYYDHCANEAGVEPGAYGAWRTIGLAARSPSEYPPEMGVEALLATPFEVPVVHSVHHDPSYGGWNDYPISKSIVPVRVTVDADRTLAAPAAVTVRVTPGTSSVRPVEVSWSAVPGAQGYEVQWAQDGAPWGDVNRRGVVTGTSLRTATGRDTVFSRGCGRTTRPRCG